MSDLSKLQDYFQVPFEKHYSSKKKFLFRKLFTQIDEEPAFLTAYAILIGVTPKIGLIKKVFAFMCTSLRVRMLQFKMARSHQYAINMYGIYPQIEDPAVIYSIGTQAEQYADRNILPPLSGSMKGNIRRFIKKLTGLHPSIAGVVIVIRKK